jgi:hypothetical protein
MNPNPKHGVDYINKVGVTRFRNGRKGRTKDIATGL